MIRKDDLSLAVANCGDPTVGMYMIFAGVNVEGGGRSVWGELVRLPEPTNHHHAGLPSCIVPILFIFIFIIITYYFFFVGRLLCFTHYMVGELDDR